MSYVEEEDYWMSQELIRQKCNIPPPLQIEDQYRRHIQRCAVRRGHWRDGAYQGRQVLCARVHVASSAGSGVYGYNTPGRPILNL